MHHSERLLSEVQALLRTRGLPVSEVAGHPEAFGSWCVTLDTQPRLRVLWDGKDTWLIVQKETSEKFRGASVWQDLWIGRAPEEQTGNAALLAVLGSLGAA